MIKRYFFAVLMAIGSIVYGADSSVSQKEISYLFSHLEQSGCEFNRNGAWYNAQEASHHLHRKYDYLIKNNLVSSTESFIEKAASKSSISGKPYQVRCGKTNPVDSNVWFNSVLKKYRTSPL